ncbi:MAG: DedA family protein [Moraxellaceae bacterium]
MQQLGEWILQVMSELGYVGIVLLMFLENVFPPIPSELIMPAAGFAAARGELSLIGIIAAGSLGSVLGAVVLYALGRMLHEQRLIALTDRYGKWLLVSSDDIRKADDWFDRHGNKIVFFGRLIPAIRSLLSIPAGMSGMPFGQFLLYTSLGTTLWSGLLALAGYQLGNNYEAIEVWIAPISKVVLGICLLLLLRFIVKRLKQRRKQPAK